MNFTFKFWDLGGGHGWSSVACWRTGPDWCYRGHGVTGLGVHTYSQLPLTLPPSPVQQVPQCDLDWGIWGCWECECANAGPLGQREADLWQRGCDLGRLGVLRVTDWARLDRGSLSTACPTPFDVGSSLLADSWCLFCILACPTLHWQTTHIWKNVLPGLSFLRNAAHLSVPQPIWTPLNLGNCGLYEFFGVWPLYLGQLRASVS